VYDDLKINIGWAVSKFYVEKHSNPEAKERISALVDEIVTAYYGIIEDADFISDKTRAGAIAKLDNMARHVLYPVSWEPYSFEDVSYVSKEEGGGLWEAYRAIKKHEHEKTVAEAGNPYDRTIWDLLPFDGNCGYTPGSNAIYIKAAFAQAPNYRPDMSAEELYAYWDQLLRTRSPMHLTPTARSTTKRGISSIGGQRQTMPLSTRRTKSWPLISTQCIPGKDRILTVKPWSGKPVRIWRL
jgi:hypothetical protein